MANEKVVHVTVSTRRLQEGAKGPKVQVSVPIPTTSEPASSVQTPRPSKS
jgi:hypothetical protein